MYGHGLTEKPSKETVCFFVGSNLTQICFGKYDLALNFDGPSISVMIQSSFGIEKDGCFLGKFEISEVLRLRDLLNCDVTAAAWADHGTLLLTFETGDVLSIYDDSDQFESYTISHVGPMIVI